MRGKTNCPHEATYLDCSNSLQGIDLSIHERSAQVPVFHFAEEVYAERPQYGGGGTNILSVFAHAKRLGFSSIQIVTDGFGEPEFDTKPSFSRGIKIDWVTAENPEPPRRHEAIAATKQKLGLL